MLTPNLEKIPQELKALPQWVCYRPDKSPVDPKTGKDAEADNPDTWATFEQAIEFYEARKGNGIAGVGFEFSFYDSFTGVDIDKCRKPETGELHYCAQVLKEYLDSYSEVSPSKTGLHIETKAKWPSSTGNQKKLSCGMKIEVYDRLRYFTMTGAHLEDTPTTIEPRQEQVAAIFRAIFDKPKDPPKSSPSPALSLADSEIIEKARGAQNGNKFDRLMGGDTSEYGGDDSAADMALCSILAFWTQDPEQIDRIFRTSGLNRDKWDRQDYRERTINKVLTSVTETYQGPRSKPQDRPHEAKQEAGSKEEAASNYKPEMAGTSDEWGGGEVR
jgi:putative DNA primase/helicase